MLYTDLTKKAMQIAFDAHKEQVDKGGMPYVYHPVHLAEQMDDELSTCVALLHDVVEDTNITFQDLSEYGFKDEIINVLKLLTHNDDVPYMDYIRNIKKNVTATKVKLADLRHNSDLTRLNSIDENAKKRIEKYEKAIQILNES